MISLVKFVLVTSIMSFILFWGVLFVIYYLDVQTDAAIYNKQVYNIDK